MTTEIAIMNKHAIALAADSAVTLSSGSRYGSNKIFNSVNKIFTLSKFHPVGVMIYGSADLMSIPWEILIKNYRNQCGEKSFDKLEDYSHSFISFLKEHVSDIPQEIQNNYFLRSIFLFTKKLSDNTLEKIKKSKNKNIKDISAQEVQDALNDVLKEIISAQKTSPLRPLFGKDAFEMALRVCCINTVE